MAEKMISTTFCALMFCGLLLLTVGTSMAAEPGYERFSHPTQVIPTIDGKWTSAEEWTDGEVTWIGTDVAFRSTLDSKTTRWIVEFFSDTTDDNADFWRFCIDQNQYGGSSPEFGHHIKFEVQGHDEIIWYMAAGTGWTTFTPAVTIIDWANSVSASPMNSTPHWILEFQIYQNAGSLHFDDVWNFLLQTYDANNPEFHAWPPTDPEIPDDWGIENYSTEAIPEGSTFVVMTLLTTVSMLIGYKYFARRKETKTQ